MASANDARGSLGLVVSAAAYGGRVAAGQVVPAPGNRRPTIRRLVAPATCDGAIGAAGVVGVAPADGRMVRVIQVRAAVTGSVAGSTADRSIVVRDAVRPRIAADQW